MATNIEFVDSIIEQAQKAKRALERDPTLRSASWVNAELQEVDSALDELVGEISDE